jgi:hypothetical protein
MPARRLTRNLRLLLVAVALVALTNAGAAGAQEPALGDSDPAVDCGDRGLAETGDAVCRDAENEARVGMIRRDREVSPSCRLSVEAVFWTGADWVRLARALAENQAPCAEYWVSIPPLAADKTALRVAQDDVVRALAPNVHPVAEMTLGDQTGWARWVERTGRSWFEAGVEFRRRMAAAGYDVDAGETWLLNEFDRSTRRDATTRDAVERSRGVTHTYPRQAMRDLVRGLYYGDIGMPTSAGIVEIGISFSHQNLPDVPAYKAELASWLADGPFWADIDPHVRFLAKEVYPDTRHWGVPGSSLGERRRRLEEYLHHPLELVGEGPEAVEPARQFLRRTYLPLANAGWAALGGDAFDFVTAHGRTMVPAETMKHFVSEQVHAIRHYAGAHPQGAPAGRLGFSWQPVNRLGLSNAEFARALDEITERIAVAIQYAYRQGGASPMGACAPPGSGEDWCAGEVPDAVFTDAWAAFENWE